MSTNNTIRLTSGGTLQVRTGVIQGLGPTGATGATGLTGPMAEFGTPTITGVAYGSSPSVSITGSGTSSDKYILALTIPTNGPDFSIGTVSALPAGATPTASFSLVGTTYNLNLGIPAGSVGPAGSSNTGFVDYKTLAGLKITATTSAASSSSTTVTVNNTAGLAAIAMMQYYNSLGSPYTYANWVLTSGATTATVTGVTSTTITVTPAVTIASGASITVQNNTVTATTAPTGDFTETYQGLRYPSNLDRKVFTPYYLQQIATELETRVVARYESSLDRFNKRGTTPPSGAVSFLEDDNGLYVRANAVDNLLAQVQIVTTVPATGTYPAGTIFLKVT